MNKIVAVLTLGAIGLLSGCASGPNRVSRSDLIDYDKVARVEQQAFRNGATVVWVNYPLKSSSAQKAQ